MTYNRNQLGRILLQRLVEETSCDMQVAIRFFYNSQFYASLSQEPIVGEENELYEKLKSEYTNG